MWRCAGVLWMRRARLPVEVLDGVRQVDLVELQSCIEDRPAQQSARRPYERCTLLVLLVAGLLADEHHSRVLAATARDRLSRLFPQLAAAAGVEVGLGGDGDRGVGWWEAGHGRSLPELLNAAIGG
jgi:hypothetical protein